MPAPLLNLLAQRHQQGREAQILELGRGFIRFGAALERAQMHAGFGVGLHASFLQLGHHFFGVAGIGEHPQLNPVTG